MTISSDTVIYAGSFLTALIFIFSKIFNVRDWVKKQDKQDETIEKLKKEYDEKNAKFEEELCVLCYASLACLSGLKQLGATGEVTEACRKLERHINKTAHKV